MEPGGALRWYVPRGTRIDARQRGRCVVVAGACEVTLGNVPATVQAALRSLAHRSRAYAAPPGDSVEEVAAWHESLVALATRGIVRCGVWSAGRRVASARLVSAHATLPDLQQSMARSHAWSRFAAVSRRGSALVAESPLSLASVELSPRALAWCAAFRRPVSLAAFCREGPRSERPAREGLYRLLAATSLIVSSIVAEEDDADLGPWEVHDAWMHARSRGGRYDAPIGRRVGHDRRFATAPVTKAPMPGAVLPLPRAARAGAGWTLARSLRERRSTRVHGDRPITRRQIGALLDRAAAIQSVQPAAPNDPQAGPTTRRPYPSGGGCHELELYLLVSHATGVARGLHHYDPLRHTLTHLDADPEHLEALVTDAAGAWNPDAVPQVLVIIAARFPRIMRRYRSLAYATTLKAAGALLQSLALVAPTLGLVTCPLGGGNAQRFAECIGSSPFVETSVAELIIGTAPSSPRA